MAPTDFHKMFFYKILTFIKELHHLFAHKTAFDLLHVAGKEYESGFIIIVFCENNQCIIQ